MFIPIWLLIFAVIVLMINFLFIVRVVRHERKVSTSSASNNTDILKLPLYVDCMEGINGCKNWCASKEWVSGCERMYD